MNYDKNDNKKLKINLSFLIKVGITLIIFFILVPKINGIVINIFSIVLPFLIAFVLSYILEPVTEWIKKFVKKRWFAVCITLILFAIVIYVFFRITIPIISKEVNDFIDNYDEIVNQLKTKINSFSKRFNFLPDDYKPTFDNILDLLKGYISDMNVDVKSIFQSLFRWVSVIVLIPMSLVYFLLDYEKIMNYFRNLLIAKGKINLKNYLGEINKSMSKFIKVNFTIMILLFVISSVCFMLVKSKYPFLFGLILAITNIIPYLGPYLGGIFPVLVALSESSIKAIIIAVIILIIQIIESDIITPFLHGRENKVHPLIVMIGIVFFGSLFGLIGMIIAIPLINIIIITIKYLPKKVDIN